MPEALPVEMMMLDGAYTREEFFVIRTCIGNGAGPDKFRFANVLVSP